MTTGMSVNNQPAQFNNYKTDRQKAKAQKFINASERDVSKMASKQYNKKYKAEDKKFAKNMGMAMNSVPLIAVASGLLSKKGTAASLRQGAEWGLALLAPKTIDKINNKAVKSSPKLKQAEKNHSGLTFLTTITASVGAFLGASALLDKGLKNPKVKDFGENVAKGAKETFKGLKNPVKLSPEMSKKLNNITSKIKVPEFAKPTIKKLRNSETAGKIAQGTMKLGKKLVKNAPVIAVLGIGAALVGRSVSDAGKYAGIRQNIKNAQLDKARELIGAYSEENNALKEENAEMTAELNELKHTSNDETVDA